MVVFALVILTGGVVIVLLLNSVAILSEDRFIARSKQTREAIRQEHD